MFDLVFEKVKGHGGTVNRARDYAEAAVKGFYQKGVMGNFATLIREHRGLFFDTESLVQVFFR